MESKRQASQTVPGGGAAALHRQQSQAQAKPPLQQLPQVKSQQQQQQQQVDYALLLQELETPGLTLQDKVERVIPMLDSLHVLDFHNALALIRRSHDTNEILSAEAMWRLNEKVDVNRRDYFHESLVTSKIYLQGQDLQRHLLAVALRTLAPTPQQKDTT